MRFLESAPRKRVSRRKKWAELGPRTKFVVFFSVTIGSPGTAADTTTQLPEKILLLPTFKIMLGTAPEFTNANNSAPGMDNDDCESNFALVLDPMRLMLPTGSSCAM